VNRYRIEFHSNGTGKQPTCLMAPDIQTALVVAEINMAGGSAELWDGDRHLAWLQRQPGTQSAYWRVS